MKRKEYFKKKKKNNEECLKNVRQLNFLLFFNFWSCFVYLTIEFLFNSNHIQLEFITNNKKVVKCWQSEIVKSFFINSHFICYYWLQNIIHKLNQSYLEVHLKLIIWGYTKYIFVLECVKKCVIQCHKGKKFFFFIFTLFHDCWWYSQFATTPMAWQYTLSIWYELEWM